MCKISLLLINKLNGEAIKFANAQMNQNRNLISDSESYLLELISVEISSISNILDNIREILKFVEDYLDNLIEYVPHYDDTVYEEEEADAEEEEEEEEDAFSITKEPPQHLYLDNLLVNVTNDELEQYTIDNGKLIIQCRQFLPSVNIKLYYFLTMMQNVEIIMHADNIVDTDLFINLENINKITKNISTFIDAINRQVL